MAWYPSLVRSGCLACAVAAAGTTSAAGQHRAGAVEAGGYVQVNWFDSSFQIDNATGAGARVGVFLRPKLSLEASASWAQLRDTIGQSIPYVPISLFALFHLPVNDDLDIILGPGYVHTEYGETANVSADGFSALAGLRFLVTKRLAVRLDSRADFYSQSPIGNDRSINFGVTAGLSFFLGPQARRDSDGDGVDDTLDRCPETSPGAVVDVTGCALPSDSDFDGVLDPLDLCADTPRGERIDQNGCPLDVDNDGVFDDRDACLDTPAGVMVDPAGCTVIPDSDGDGVSDDLDQCAATPPSTLVDDTGCPLPPVPRVREIAYFPLNLATLSAATREALRHLADSLADLPQEGYQIEGHADSSGPDAFNRALSQARAEAVRDALSGFGVSPTRLTAMGYGSDRPIASNDTAEGRARNRRATLRRLD
jgi:OOP family OmpA-OmpF porin